LSAEQGADLSLDIIGALLQTARCGKAITKIVGAPILETHFYEHSFPAYGETTKAPARHRKR
jgi:hypothetical protein